MWKRFDITFRYQIFFLLTAVFPISMFSVYLLENVYIKANRNLSEILESGLLYVEDTVNANHHELAMSARQAAFLSLNDSYHEYLATGDASRFKTYLERYQKTNSFDVVLIMSPDRRILFNVGQTAPFNQKSFDTLVSSSLAGKVLTGFERFQEPVGQHLNLAYVAASPIPHSYNDKRVDGVLVIGRFLKNDVAYSNLQRIMLQHRFRVLVREPDGYSVEVSSDESLSSKALTSDLETRLKILGQDKRNHQFGFEETFKEYIQGRSYLTRVFLLRNQHAEPAGFIVISVPRAELKDFMKQNLLFILLFILLLSGWILMAGRWFYQDVIEPMSSLTRGLKRVVADDFTVRLPMRFAYHTEARETIRSFNRLVSRLEENEQLRATFISMLSHDLKTPLLAQQRVTEMLQDGFDMVEDPQIGRLLTNLRRSNEDLLEMVRTILETYRYEEGQITLDIEPVHLGQLMAQCFETLHPLAEENGILLKNLIADDFPLLSADPVQLKRLFQNLASNAVQNIPEGCEVWAAAEECPDGTVVVRIGDNGPGLSEKVLKHLFERYNSGPRLTKRIGSGLGLFICRMIAELHNGKIEVQSISGEGTIFSISLPKHSSMMSRKRDSSLL